MLSEQRRTQLDGIVEQMVRSNEPDNIIQFVVDDFKTKYEEEVEPQKPGFFQGIGQDVQKRGLKLGEQVERIAGEESRLGIRDIPEVALNVAGQAIGAGFDIFGRAISKVIPEFIEEPLRTGIQKVVQTEPVESIIEKYQEWKEKNPRVAQDLESAVNITSLFPIGRGAQIVGGKALVTTGKLAGREAIKLEQSLAKQTFNEALDIIKPVLTKKEKVGALTAKRGVVTQKILPRRFETISLTPTKKEIETANVVKDVVKKSNNPIENITSLAETSQEIGQKIRGGLEQSEAIWNKNELKSKLSSIEKPITVKSDRTINNQADNFTKAVLKLAEETDKKAVGILDIRQEFDNLIQREFPNLYDKEMTPMRQYISGMRRTLNKFAESKLPEGKLPDGTMMRTEMRRQHLMLDAIENIAEKTASAVDTSVVKRVMSIIRENPLTTFVTGGIVTYTALAGMLTNPIVLGTLALGGTYKIGKAIITSKILKQSLIQILKELERLGKTTDAKVIQELANQLPE